MSLSYVYLLIVVLHLIYLLSNRRMFDLFLIASLSFYIYHIPYFFGDYHTGATVLDLGKPSKEAYYFVISFSLIIFCLNLFFDYRYSHYLNSVAPSYSYSINAFTRYLVWSLFYLSLLLFSFSLLITGVEGFKSAKGGGDVGAGMFFYVLSVWTVMGLSVVAFFCKRYFYLLYSTLIILFHLLVVGSRSWFVIFVLLLVFLFELRRSKSCRLLFRPIVIFGGPIFLFFILLFEHVGHQIVALEFGEVLDSLSNRTTYFRLLELRESFIVSSHFEFALSAEPLGWYYGVHRVISFFPLLPGLWSEIFGGLSRYSDVVLSGYESVGYGLASNVWAELFHIYGYFGVFVFFCIWVSLIYKVNYLYLSGAAKPIHYFLMPFFIFLAFYIHRVDFTFVSGFFKYMVFCYLFVIFSRRFILVFSGKKGGERSL